MDDNNEKPEGAATSPVVPYQWSSTATERKSKKLVYSVEGADRMLIRLLKEMRAASGLSVRAIAERMGIERNSLNQYFWQRRGGGSSRLSWFLRFAEACGCRVWLTFPSLKEQVELKAKYYKPAGNPNFKKKEEK